MDYEPRQEFPKNKHIEPIRFVSVSAAYFSTALISSFLALQPGDVIAFWPPAGIALWAILVFGYRFWPAILVGDIAKNIWMYLSVEAIGPLIHESILLLVMSIGATSQAVIGSILLKGYTRSSQLFSNPKYTIRFVLITLGVGTVSATVASVCLFNAGEIGIDSILSTWCIWWLGDSLGIILFVPLLTTRRAEFEELVADRRWIGTGVSHAIVIFAALSISNDRVEEFVGGLVKSFHLLPLLVWIAFRQNRTGTCIACISILWILFYFSLDSVVKMNEVDRLKTVAYHQSTCYSIISMVLLITSTIDAYRIGRSDLEKQSHDLLEKSAELKAVIAAQPDTYLWLDKEGEIVRYHANDESHLFSRLHSGLRWPDIIPPTLKPQFDALIEQVGEHRTPGVFEYSITSRSHTKYNEARFLPLMEKNVLVVIRDITDRKHAEKNLQASVKKARFAAEIGAVMTSGTQLGETLGECTRLIVQHLEVATARIWILRNESDILELAASAGEHTTLKGGFSHVPVGMHNVGKVALTGKPMFTNRMTWTERLSPEELETSKGLKAFAGYPLQLHGRRLGVIGLFSDREIQPYVMESLASVSNTISIGIEQQRSREELRQAKESAEASSRFASEMLADISQEIRTPMIDLLSMTDKLLETDLNEHQRNCLDAIRSSGGFLLTITDDIVDASRIASGQMRLDDSDFRLRVNLSEMIKPLTQIAHKKGLELACEIAGDVPDALHGDWKRLKQVLMNTISRSIRFTTRGEVVLKVSALRRSDDGVTLQFLVRDTGSGNAAEGRSRHSDPIAQLDGSMTDEYGGSKMSLSISSMLVSKMGGELRFETRTDQGTDCMFTVRMRIAPKTIRTAERHSLDPLKGFA